MFSRSLSFLPNFWCVLNSLRKCVALGGGRVSVSTELEVSGHSGRRWDGGSQWPEGKVSPPADTLRALNILESPILSKVLSSWEVYGWGRSGTPGFSEVCVAVPPLGRRPRLCLEAGFIGTVGGFQDCDAPFPSGTVLSGFSEWGPELGLL